MSHHIAISQSLNGQLRVGAALLPDGSNIENALGYVQREWGQTEVTASLYVEGRVANTWQLSENGWVACETSTQPISGAASDSNWLTSHVVMVANPKGGAGKTLLSLLLAQTFAEVGISRPLVWDLNPLRGSLAWRTEGATHIRTSLDLMKDLDRLDAGDVNINRYTEHYSGWDLLRSAPRRPQENLAITTEEYQRAYAHLTKMFGLIILDTGNDETTNSWRFAADISNLVLVPATPTRDHLIPAQMMLRDLGSHAPKLSDNALIVLTQSSRSVRKPTAKTWHSTQPVVCLRHDKSLSGEHVELGAAGRATKNTMRSLREMIQNRL